MAHFWDGINTKYDRRASALKPLVYIFAPIMTVLVVNEENVIDEDGLPVVSKESMIHWVLLYLSSSADPQHKSPCVSRTPC